MCEWSDLASHLVLTVAWLDLFCRNLINFVLLKQASLFVVYLFVSRITKKSHINWKTADMD